MIVKYECENFGPFKDNISFSMKPGKVTERFKDGVHDINGKLKLSKMAVIVGENAGGKTNFMRSIDFFKFILLECDRPRSYKILCNKYRNDIQKFNISVLIDEYIYTYCLTLDGNFYTSEELMIRNFNQKEEMNKSIFSIKRVKCDKVVDSDKETNLEIEMDIKFNNRYINNEFEKLIKNKKTISNGLFIKFLDTIGIKEASIFLKYIKDRLVINLPDDASYNIYKRFEKNIDDLKIMKEETFVDIFSLIDSSITGVEVDDDEPFVDTKIVRKLNSGETFKIKINRESSGVKEFFAWAIQIWQVIYEDKVVFADEIDKVLNSLLAIKVINYIKGSEHKGQFIFSTHNILHLNTNIFMKEQIYFITKDIELLESEMYSLSDFADYKYDNPRVYELYLKGLLGGVPNA